MHYSKQSPNEAIKCQSWSLTLGSVSGLFETCWKSTWPQWRSCRCWSWCVTPSSKGQPLTSTVTCPLPRKISHFLAAAVDSSVPMAKGSNCWAAPGWKMVGIEWLFTSEEWDRVCVSVCVCVFSRVEMSNHIWQFKGLPFYMMCQLEQLKFF